MWAQPSSVIGEIPVLFPVCPWNVLVAKHVNFMVERTCTDVMFVHLVSISNFQTQLMAQVYLSVLVWGLGVCWYISQLSKSEVNVISVQLHDLTSPYLSEHVRSSTLCVRVMKAVCNYMHKPKQKFILVRFRVSIKKKVCVHRFPLLITKGPGFHLSHLKPFTDL